MTTIKKVVNIEAEATVAKKLAALKDAQDKLLKQIAEQQERADAIALAKEDKKVAAIRKIAKETGAINLTDDQIRKAFVVAVTESKRPAFNQPSAPAVTQ